MVIRQMKPLGFSLEEMAEILDALAAPPGAGNQSGRLAGYLARAADQRAEMMRNLTQADEFIQRLSGQI